MSKPFGGPWCLTALVLALTLVGETARADDVLPPGEPESLDAFMEREVTAQLERYHIPGATVAVVRDGQVVLARGYGYADAEHRRPVVADRTVFRVASISKLFVWTAVMQLVERGQLDLDADVNTYLEEELRLPATYAQPITLAHLMAHAGGFEVHERLWAGGPPPDSLTEYLRQRMPARVRPPGELSAYSDYGTSLAAHLVERASGMPFEQYLRENLLEPLGMKRSFFRRKVPPELAADMALGHTLEEDHLRALPMEQVVVASGGSMITTATDLARFMLAHLQGGQHEGQRILREETVRRMHRQHFTHDPRLSGWAHGFMEFHLNGQRLIGHMGDAYLFHSLLVLMPQHGTGLFVSYNGPGEKYAFVAQRARMELLQAFLSRYHPAPPAEAPAPLKVSAGRMARFAGGYQTTWRAYGTAEASAGWREEIRVEDNGDGTLRIKEPGNEPRNWVEVESRMFRLADDPTSLERAVFREDARGRSTHLFFQNRPSVAYERAPWYETSPFTYGLLAVCIGAFALTLMASSIRWNPNTGLLAAIGLLNLFFLMGFMILLHHRFDVRDGHPPPLLGVTLGCAFLASVLTLGAVGWSARAWWLRSGRLRVRLYLTCATLAAVAFMAWLHHWHLLGFKA
ncbi:serine hydrolase [Archangium sp.]|jgi:CubicO group peptidase (beta-lactamase class C family)|uniref:serine hydrolase n=1 Tax=Archangium sp. TaxID=1872627 RepID=UPI002EDB2BB1